MAKVCIIAPSCAALINHNEACMSVRALRPASGVADQVIGVQHYSDKTDDPACHPQGPHTRGSLEIMLVLVLLALRTTQSQELAMTVRFTSPVPLDYLVHCQRRQGNTDA